MSSRATALLSLWERHQSLRRALRQTARNRLEMPLSYWVWSEDRGVPLPLVRRTVGDLLEAEFDSLTRVPGVGVTKLAKLMDLLERVRAGDPQTAEATAARAALRTHSAPPEAKRRAAQWAVDCRTILEAGLADRTLGLLVDSLGRLSRSLWDAPLGQFMQQTYDSLQSIPYFGKRRVETVVGLVNQTAERARAATRDLTIVDWHPSRIQAMETWLRDQLDLPVSARRPPLDELRQGLVSPLIEQLEIDLGPRAATIAGYDWSLTVHRLQPVRASRRPRAPAEIAAISRPRLFQLREELRRACAVRWPHGERLLAELAGSLSRRRGNEPAPEAVKTLMQDFFVSIAKVEPLRRQVRTDG